MVLEDASFAVDFKTCSIIQTTPNILNNGPRSAELMRSDNEPKDLFEGAVWCWILLAVLVVIGAAVMQFL